MTTRLEWHAHAEALAVELRGIPSGRREPVLEDYGRRSQLAPATLRSYLAARAHLQALSETDPDLALRLRSVPSVSVEVLRRWHARNPAEAREAALALLSGSHTTRSLAAAERDARGTEDGVGGKGAWRAALLTGPGCVWVNGVPRAADTFPPGAGVLGGGFCVPETADRLFKVDLFAGSRYYDGVPCMMVGPYSSEALYWHRAVDWCLRAVGLSHVYGVAALLLPEGCPSGPFQTWLREAEEWFRREGAPDRSLGVLFVRTLPNGGVGPLSGDSGRPPARWIAPRP